MFPSQTTLSAQVGISDRALRDNLAALVARGHLLEAGHRARCVVYKMSLFNTEETGSKLPRLQRRRNRKQASDYRKT